MRIAVDVMGGDHGSGVIIAGVRRALAKLPEIETLFLVGAEEESKEELVRQKCSDSRLEIHPASQVLTMDDKPVEAIRRKRDSSMLRAIELVKDEKADAIISPGNTGGLLAASTIRLRTLNPVDRAAIATIMPSYNGEFLLVDAGANADCKPSHLVQFATMGSIYCREILGKSKPRVAVLSNGTEESKGTEFTREVLRQIRKTDLNCIGYCEGYHLFDDGVDVVVADGFVGNIVLKSCESLAKALKKTIKSELTANPIRKLGSLFVYTALKGIRRRFDADAYGGAPLLGLNGNVIKAHGSSSEIAIMNAVRVAAESVQHKIKQTIESEVARVNQQLDLEPAGTAS